MSKVKSISLAIGLAFAAVVPVLALEGHVGCAVERAKRPNEVTIVVSDQTGAINQLTVLRSEKVTNSELKAIKKALETAFKQKSFCSIVKEFVMDSAGKTVERVTIKHLSNLPNNSDSKEADWTVVEQILRDVLQPRANFGKFHTNKSFVQQLVHPTANVMMNGVS